MRPWAVKQQLPKSDFIPERPNNGDLEYDARFPLQILGETKDKKSEPSLILPHIVRIDG